MDSTSSVTADSLKLSVVLIKLRKRAQRGGSFCPIRPRHFSKTMTLEKDCCLLDHLRCSGGCLGQGCATLGGQDGALLGDALHKRENDRMRRDLCKVPPMDTDRRHGFVYEPATVLKQSISARIGRLQVVYFFGWATCATKRKVTIQDPCALTGAGIVEESKSLFLKLPTATH